MKNWTSGLRHGIAPEDFHVGTPVNDLFGVLHLDELGYVLGLDTAEGPDAKHKCQRGEYQPVNEGVPVDHREAGNDAVPERGDGEILCVGQVVRDHRS